MKINTTFQLMDEIANAIAGPKPKVIGNMTRATRDHLKNFFEMSPLKDSYTRIPEDPVNFIQFPIEGIPTYPIKAISILTGFEPYMQEQFCDEVDNVNVVLLHPYTSIDSRQAIILSNHFLRTSFELGGLMNINKETFQQVHIAADGYSDYTTNMKKADNLLFITSNSLKNLYSYLLGQTKELGLLQDQYTFDKSIEFDLDFSDIVTPSEFLNTFVLDAMVNTTIRKIYNLIVTGTDKSIIVDKTIAFDKLFNNIYAQEFIRTTDYIPPKQYEQLYEKYNIIVNSLIDSFMDAQPDQNIDMWIHMICMAYEKYNDNKKVD